MDMLYNRCITQFLQNKAHRQQRKLLKFPMTSDAAVCQEHLILPQQRKKSEYHERVRHLA